MSFDPKSLKADDLRKKSLKMPHFYIPSPCSTYCRCGASQYDEIHFKNGHWLTREEINEIYGVSV